MKTGFICASGFNLVASATRDGKRLIAVVLGAPSSQARAMKAAQLLERGFNSDGGLTWLMPSLGTVETMQPINAAPPNLRDEMCGPHRKRQATEDEDDVVGRQCERRFALRDVPVEPAPEDQGRGAAAGQRRRGRAGGGLYRSLPQARHRGGERRAEAEGQIQDRKRDCERRRQAEDRRRQAGAEGRRGSGCGHHHIGRAEAEAQEHRPEAGAEDLAGRPADADHADADLADEMTEAGATPSATRSATR